MQMQRKHRINIRTFEMHAKREMRSLLLNKKAASVVLSTVILTAGVIAMSIAVLYWTYSMGKIGNIEYSKNTAASSSAIWEKLGFEVISGSGNNLTVYLINWGKADDVSIAHVLILNSSYSYVGSNITNIIFKDINSNESISGNALNVGHDGFFITSLSTSLNPGDLYYVRIVTSRGRNFDGSFVSS